MELFANIAPNIAEKFQFCTGEYRKAGLTIGYKGCQFHMVMKEFMIQAGDFVKANSGQNTNGCQIEDWLCYSGTEACLWHIPTVYVFHRQNCTVHLVANHMDSHDESWTSPVADQ
ncbi:hypothetical protein L6164_013426 [Bauhinia variegata]|uniref:Uncharacterized protein n=1 Tax=Bauhinia variegata TaxID=167791 RepID=A0ACB9NFC1_BAUVA|nr:hypothetical protein L6164_013426 [Bauhinia variegata]